MGIGRRAGGRSDGYYFRTGRGWYARKDGKYVPLKNELGEPLKDKATPKATIKAAWKRAMGETRETAAESSGSAHKQLPEGVTVENVCAAYLATVKDSGAESTLIVRENTLFDFCVGLPSRFFPRGNKPKPMPTKSDYIHKGYGKFPVEKLLPLHIDQWLQVHPTWKGCRRTKIQAVKRAFNYAVKAGLIPKNPIKGYTTPKQNARATYLTPEQEQALIDCTNPAMAKAIKVGIRTGARPGCEFAKLTAAHVLDKGNRMEWVFKPEESKTSKLRKIRITDAEIIKIVREQIERYPHGPIFRNSTGGRWTRELLTEKFRHAKQRAMKQGMQFDADCCMYSCRHTYAKRILSGYWSGKTTNIETLAILMGNSPQVCRDHYLQWCEHFAEPVWESA